MKRLSTLLMLLLAITIGSQQAFSQAVTITLTPGWNWISYPNAVDMEVNEALATYAPLEGDIVKGAFSFAIYDQGRWIGGLTHFMPGRGYMYYSTRSEMTSFVFTQATSSIVATAQPTEITDVSAVVGGVVTLPEGSHVFLRGVCWGTEPNPDIDGSHTSDGSGIGAFVSILEGLDIDITYHVRAYAVTDYGLAYGSDVTFTTGLVYTITASSNPEEGGEISGMGTYQDGTECTLIATPNEGYTFIDWTEGGNQVSTNASYTFTVTGNCTLIANFEVSSSVPTGAINGLFSVSATQQVWFSQGNLQYIGSASTPYWKFAENQWDYLGTTTGQNSDSENVDRDLFGWGTSGFDHGAVDYQPWATSTTSSHYFAYGNRQYHLYDQTGKADWGYNTILNGGNQLHTWRTLTREEWEYLFNGRSLAMYKYGHGRINEVNGVILLPDNWALPDGLSFIPGNSVWANVYNTTQWNQMEVAGAVFLPTAGCRVGLDVDNEDISGYYWSSSNFNEYPAHHARYLGFHSNSLPGVPTNHRNYGYSVRLVQDYQP